MLSCQESSFLKVARHSCRGQRGPQVPVEVGTADTMRWGPAAFALESQIGAAAVNTESIMQQGGGVVRPSAGGSHLC